MNITFHGINLFVILRRVKNSLHGLILVGPTKKLPDWTGRFRLVLPRMHVIRERSSQ